MSPCDLNDLQKALLRSLVPGLKHQDGTVNDHWLVAFFPNGSMRIQGLADDIWQATWRGKVGAIDFAKFVECGFFKEGREGDYLLDLQAIILAVENNFLDGMRLSETKKLDEKKWDFFISHASEDKTEIARPLAEMLMHKGFKVWYDEFSLELGDSLRRSIERGLVDSKYGIVILSPNFFSKSWPQNELDGLFAREIAENQKVILPVWHKVNQQEIAKYSVILADRMAAPTNKGIEFVVDRILRVLPPETAMPQISEIQSSDKVKWIRVGNLFWLCHDLIELHRWLLSNVSKEWIDVGLRQSAHHARELNLDTIVVNKLEQITNEANLIQPEDWSIERREIFASEVKAIFNVIAQITQAHQKEVDTFDSGPG